MDEVQVLDLHQEHWYGVENAEMKADIHMNVNY